MNQAEVLEWKSYKWKKRGYKRIKYEEFNYDTLKDLAYRYKQRDGKYTDAVIMADCETSKDIDSVDPGPNHVVCWTITIGAFGRPLFTVLGRKPSDLCEFIQKFMAERPEEKLIIYYHNLSYDWVFNRGFLFKYFGFPIKMLATNPHYPIYIEFANGLIIRDSLILAQRSIEKWSKDLQTAHQKQVGSWDYNLFRNQNELLTENEERYAEYDTLAGVECLIATMETLNKRICSMPYTATGVPRQETRKRGGRVKAHQAYEKLVMTCEQQLVSECVYHGGYVHCNRDYLGVIMPDVMGGDFTSSYPKQMLTGLVPMEKFASYHNCSVHEILKQKDKIAFMFKLILIGVKLKPDIPMPVLQFSKAIKSINAVCDNGRVLCADYIEIYTSELSLDLIISQYDIKQSACIDVYAAHKGLLPKWYRDYVWECFQAKCQLKGKDPVLYSISKAKVNSLYGLMVQRPVKDDISEIYEGIRQGEYELTHKDYESAYDEHIHRLSSILPYQWGIWITENAMYELFKMGQMCDIWLYSDTDSVYGIGWHMDQVEAYNKKCLEELKAAGYGAVTIDGVDYILGSITFDVDAKYSEFVSHGAKRYAGRHAEDGKLAITVAGVPKKTGAKCLKNDLSLFQPGFVFDGPTTGKLTHSYFFSDKGIYTDRHGNEICDSIDLSPCDYKLSSATFYDLDELMYNTVEIQVYEDNISI